MQKNKFAIFDYVKNRNEIDIKFPAIKKMPNFIWQWYVKKFCPLAIKNIDIDLANAYFVKLPIEKKENNNLYAHEIFIESMKKLGDLDIIKCPSEFITDANKCKIAVSDGAYFFTLVIMDAIKKISINVKKELSECEIFILDNDFYLTNILLDNICEHVNYLTVITNQKSLYKNKEQEIFMDTGLNINVMKYKKNIISEADIIINNNFDEDFIYAIKKGALYFELKNTNKQNYCDEIKLKRPNVFVFNKLNLIYKNHFCDNNILEMLFYCIDHNFKKCFMGKYNKDSCQQTKNKIKELGIKVSSCQK